MLPDISEAGTVKHPEVPEMLELAVAVSAQ